MEKQIRFLWPILCSFFVLACSERGPSYKKAAADPATEQCSASDPQIAASPLMLASASGDIAGLRKLVDAKENLDQLFLTKYRGHTMGRTALICAIENRQEAALDFLLKAGAKPDVTNHHGTSPLAIAVGTKNLKAVSLLVEHHADPNLLNGSGWGALGYAVTTNDEKVMEAILKAPGLKIDLGSAGGKPALQMAADAGYLKMVELLVANRADTGLVEVAEIRSAKVRAALGAPPKSSPLLAEEQGLWKGITGWDEIGKGKKILRANYLHIKETTIQEIQKCTYEGTTVYALAQCPIERIHNQVFVTEACESRVLIPGAPEIRRAGKAPLQRECVAQLEKGIAFTLKDEMLVSSRNAAGYSRVKSLE